jgi:hypothetical protein
MLLCLFLPFSTVPEAGAANQNCLNPHCYSVKFDSYTAAAGVLDNLNNNNLTPGGASASKPYFFNSETWLANTGAGGGWVETGISNGWNFTLNTGAYAYFEFDQNNSGGDSGWYYYDYTTPNGTNHTTQISRAVTPYFWAVYLDGALEAVSGNDGFWTGQPQVGGELYSNLSNEHADTFNQTTYQVNSTTGAVQPWSGAAGYRIHAGFNGVDHNTFWSWNAP